MDNLIIAKFGGSILRSGKDYLRIAEHVKRLVEGGHRVVVVVSAMKGVTDKLSSLLRNPLNYVSYVGSIEEIHSKALMEVLGSEVKALGSSFNREITALLTELTKLAWAINMLNEASPRIRDYVLSFGERLSSLLMASALDYVGLKYRVLTGYEAGIVTNDNFGEATPIHEVSSRLVRARLIPLIKEGVVPVVTGFIGGTERGETTVLGRGGSDYTATLLASYLGAREVRLYTDVPGIMSADPKLVPEARVIPRLSFIEAMELAYLGGKKFHPRTFEPVKGTNIKVKVLSIERSEGGTIIDEIGGPPPLKAVVAINDLSLISVKGGGMVGRLGTAAEVMGLAAESGVNIMSIAQPVSEVSISLLTGSEEVGKLKLGFNKLVRRGIIESVEVLDKVSAISIVGYGLRRSDLLSRVISKALSSSNDVKMMVWYRGDVSITFVTSSEDAEALVRSMHEEVLRSG